jgi:hypothetical protein
MTRTLKSDSVESGSLPMFLRNLAIFTRTTEGHIPETQPQNVAARRETDAASCQDGLLDATVQAVHINHVLHLVTETNNLPMLDLILSIN